MGKKKLFYGGMLSAIALILFGVTGYVSVDGVTNDRDFVLGLVIGALITGALALAYSFGRSLREDGRD